MRYRIRLDVALEPDLTDEHVEAMRASLEAAGRMLRGSLGAGTWLIRDEPLVCKTQLHQEDRTRGCVLADEVETPRGGIRVDVSPQQDSLFGAIKAAAKTIKTGKALYAACLAYDPGTWAQASPRSATNAYSDLAQLLVHTEDRLITGKRGTYGFWRVHRAEQERGKSKKRTTRKSMNGTGA